MKFSLETNSISQNSLMILSAYSSQKNSSDKDKPIFSHWPKAYQQIFVSLKLPSFRGEAQQQQLFYLENGAPVLVIGLGEKRKAKAEVLRRSIAAAFKWIKSQKFESLSIHGDSFKTLGDLAKSLSVVAESLLMTDYTFNKYKTKNEDYDTEVSFLVEDKRSHRKIEASLQETHNLCQSLNLGRDFINEAPNILHSEKFAALIEKDVRDNLKKVKAKILKKPEIKKENMNLFLSVNSGSAHDARLVHLTYTPSKKSRNSRHIALVGKGITFDTGGYSLKPAAFMVGMKGDMGGAATVYAAFRAAVLNNSPHKITCIIPMTDNAVNQRATVPETVIKARNGKTVEILNTDAEGRLILADALDYACDQKPDQIIDAATLTGAVLVALGSEVCGIMGNNKSLTQSLLKAAQSQDEYMWELPIIEEFRKDMKASQVADLQNIGSNRNAGTPKAAAFLEEFIKEDIAWAHLDIAGVSDDQGYLPYCPAKGASGLIVRTLTHFLVNA